MPEVANWTHVEAIVCKFKQNIIMMSFLSICQDVQMFNHVNGGHCTTRHRKQTIICRNFHCLSCAQWLCELVHTPGSSKVQNTVSTPPPPPLIWVHSSMGSSDSDLCQHKYKPHKPLECTTDEVKTPSLLAKLFRFRQTWTLGYWYRTLLYKAPCLVWFHGIYSLQFHLKT